MIFTIHGRPEVDRTASDRELEKILREHAGRLAAALVRITGDFATAEDLVQDAVLAAPQRWPIDGVPDRPDAWLFTVARNRGLDVLRRQSNYRAKLAGLRWHVQRESDDRLRLIFTCCHPALSRPAQIALTLRVVCGLTTAQIARAFLVRETTVAQRITRAKRKIADAGIPYRVPDPNELGARLREVLAVIYLLLNEGYLSTAERGQSRDLVDDADWLASQVHDLMPAEPEVAGLLALIRMHRARADARFDPDGHLVLLEHQDRSNWDHEGIAAASGVQAPSLAPTWAELHPGSLLLEGPDRPELARADDWLALARTLRMHDPDALRALGFFGRDRNLLERMIVTLTRTASTDEEMRPLSEAVLLRIEELVPDLASGAHGAVEIARLVEKMERERWWVPHDIPAPPSTEPVTASSDDFERDDVQRVLRDL